MSLQTLYQVTALQYFHKSNMGFDILIFYFSKLTKYLKSFELQFMSEDHLLEGEGVPSLLLILLHTVLYY